MPQVIQYGSPKVKEQVNTSINKGPEAKALNLDYGLNDLLKGGQMVAQQAQKAGIAEAESALTAFEKEKNIFLFNPETGVFNAKGRTAYEGRDEAEKGLTAIQKKYADTLSSSWVRDAFTKSSDGHVIKGQRDIMSHAAEGLRTWETANAKAIVENGLEGAFFYYSQPEELNNQLQTALPALRDQMDLEGITDGDKRTELEQTLTSKFYVNAIRRGITDNSVTGRELYDQYKDKLEGDDDNTMLRELKVAEEAHDTKRNTAAAKSQAEELMRNFASDVRNVDREQVNEALDKIKEEKDIEEKYRVQKEYDAMLSRAIREDNAENGESLYMFSDGVKNDDDLATTIENNPEKWDRLTKTQQRQLISGRHITTDPLVMQELMSLPDSEFMRIDINDGRLLGKLSSTDRAKVTQMIVDKKEGKGKTFVQSMNQVISSNVTRLFGAKRKWNSSERERASEFSIRLQDFINQEVESKGVNLTPTELNAKVVEATREFIIEDGWLFDKRLNIKDTPLPEMAALNDARMNGYDLGDVFKLRDYMIDNDIPITRAEFAARMKEATK